MVERTHGVREVSRSSRLSPTKKKACAFINADIICHMIKTVLFDIDGVLIDSFEANFEFYKRLFTKAGYVPPTLEAYTPLFQSTMMDVIRTVTKSTSDDEIDRIMTIGKDRTNIYPYDLITIPTGLSTILTELHTIYTLGIVTSRIKGGVFQIPQLRPFEKYFDIVVSFEDTENHKPHPDPLLFAMEHLRVQQEETVYIGDQEADVLAAHAAHIPIIIYSKKFFPQADRCIASFGEIPTAIASLE